MEGCQLRQGVLKLFPALVVAGLAAHLSCFGGGGPGWKTAELIETDDAGDARYPQVAMDAGGNAIAVWDQSDGTRRNIWANRYVAGQGWGTAELIETDGAGDACSPDIATDSSGNAIAVWHQSDGARVNIRANRYVVGVGWGTAELIETDDAGGAYSADVATDSSGNAIAVWHQFDGARTNIWANRYVVGAGWGTAELIETEDAGGAYNPQVAMNSGGNAVAVWYESDGTRFNVLANRYDAASGWGTTELIETDDAGDALWPHIAMDPGANAIAVWYQAAGTRENIWANRYVAGSGWGTAQLIETDDTGNAHYPRVTMDPDGNAVAVWYQADGTRENIWANRYVAGSGWEAAQLIETDDTGNAHYPRVTMHPDGNAVAVWHQSDGARYNIWANRYVAGSGWGTAQLLETDDAGSAEFPQVAMDPDGNAIVVWDQHDGTRWNIWSNRFE